jgi:hypothetical protein
MQGQGRPPLVTGNLLCQGLQVLLTEKAEQHGIGQIIPDNLAVDLVLQVKLEAIASEYAPQGFNILPLHGVIRKSGGFAKGAINALYYLIKMQAYNLQSVLCHGQASYYFLLQKSQVRYLINRTLQLESPGGMLLHRPGGIFYLLFSNPSYPQPLATNSEAPVIAALPFKPQEDGDQAGPAKLFSPVGAIFVAKIQNRNRHTTPVQFLRRLLYSVMQCDYLSEAVLRHRPGFGF